MTHLKVDKKSLMNEIENNFASPEYYSETHIDIETGEFIAISNNDRRYENRNSVPIPALNPEGHGHESDRFESFLEHPPQNFIIPTEELQGMTHASIDEKIVFLKNSGWESIEEDWIACNENALEFYVCEWVEGLKIQDLTGCDLSWVEIEEPINVELV